MLNELTNKINLNQVFSFFEDLFLFYFKPLKFFRIFNSKTSMEKTKQACFYIFIFISLGSLLFPIPLFQIYRFVTSNLLQFLEITIVLLLSNFSLYYITNNKTNISNIIFFSLLFNFLYIPFYIIFYCLFLNYENYLYLYASNIIILLLFIIITIFFSIIFYTKFKHILISIILTIIFLNIVSSIKIYIQLQGMLTGFSTSNDPIVIERYNLLDKINSRDEIIPFGIPKYTYLFQGKDTITQIVFDDKHSSYKHDSKKYKKLLIVNQQRADSLLSNAKFIRNKVYLRKISDVITIFRSQVDFKELSESKHKIVTKYQYGYDKHKMKRFFTKDNERIYFSSKPEIDTFTYNVTVVSFPDYPLIHANNLFDEKFSLIEKSNKAYSPLKIFKYIYFLPSLFFYMDYCQHAYTFNDLIYIEDNKFWRAGFEPDSHI